MRLLIAIGAVAAFAPFSTAQTGGPPAVLLQAVSATEAAKAPYAFDIELTRSAQTWRARFDPSASPRLRLLQPGLDELSASDRRAFGRLADQIDGVSWCAGENMGRVENVRLLRDDEGTATYTFQPTPDSIRGEQARRFADRLSGEFTLTKHNPDISSIRVFSPRAFSPLPLVQVEHLDISIACETAPNGRHYAAETISEVRGSAFGQAFDERSVQRTGNLRSAP